MNKRRERKNRKKKRSSLGLTEEVPEAAVFEEELEEGKEAEEEDDYCLIRLLVSEPKSIILTKEDETAPIEDSNKQNTNQSTIQLQY